jgi:hypothetical protein
MNTVNYILIIAILSIIIVSLWKDFQRGVCTATLFLISLSPRLAIVMPGEIFSFTIQRMIIIVLFVSYIFQREKGDGHHDIPCLKYILVVGASYFLSVLLSNDFRFSIVQYLAMTVDVYIYYLIACLSIKSKESANIMLKYVVYAITITSLISFVEKYTGFNPVDYIVFEYIRNPKYGHDILSTFPHRILMGTAAAMGVPLAMSYKEYLQKSNIRSKWLWIAMALMISSCFFSYSRGPWIGLIIGCLILFIIGSSYSRKIIGILIVLSLVVFIIRPGAWETIYHRGVDTVDTSTFKHGTFEYRLELWRVAIQEVTKTVRTALFGFGLGAGDFMIFDRTLSYSGKSVEIWSWDNEYALRLLETGAIGLFCTIIMYVMIIKKLFVERNNIRQDYSYIVSGIIASVSIMLFMMTNVHIFAVQLHYLFWSLVAIGLKINRDEISYKNAPIIV